MQLIASLVVSITLVGVLSLATAMADEETPAISDGFRKIEEWLKTVQSHSPSHVLKMAEGYLEENRGSMKEDEIDAWTKFTAPRKIKRQNQCRNEAAAAFWEIARETGLASSKWREDDKQKLNIQQFIMTIGCASAKHCQAYFDREIESCIKSKSSFPLLTQLVATFVNEYKLPPIQSTDLGKAVHLFKTIRSGKPELEIEGVDYTKVSTASVMVKALAFVRANRLYDERVGVNPATKELDPNGLVDHIFSICENYIHNDDVQRLIPPLEVYSKFLYHNVTFSHESVHHALLNYKFCENFLQRDQQQVTKELVEYNASHPDEFAKCVGINMHA